MKGNEEKGEECLLSKELTMGKEEGKKKEKEKGQIASPPTLNMGWRVRVEVQIPLGAGGYYQAKKEKKKEKRKCWIM
jgi:hypothetical protein